MPYMRRVYRNEPHKTRRKEIRVHVEMTKCRYMRRVSQRTSQNKKKKDQSACRNDKVSLHEESLSQ